MPEAHPDFCSRPGERQLAFQSLGDSQAGPRHWPQACVGVGGRLQPATPVLPQAPLLLTSPGAGVQGRGHPASRESSIRYPDKQAKPVGRVCNLYGGWAVGQEAPAGQVPSSHPSQAPASWERCRAGGEPPTSTVTQALWPAGTGKALWHMPVIPVWSTQRGGSHFCFF